METGKETRVYTHTHTPLLNLLWLTTAPSLPTQHTTAPGAHTDGMVACHHSTMARLQSF